MLPIVVHRMWIHSIDTCDSVLFSCQGPSDLQISPCFCPGVGPACCLRAGWHAVIRCRAIRVSMSIIFCRAFVFNAFHPYSLINCYLDTHKPTLSNHPTPPLQPLFASFKDQHVQNLEYVWRRGICYSQQRCWQYKRLLYQSARSSESYLPTFQN